MTKIKDSTEVQMTLNNSPELVQLSFSVSSQLSFLVSVSYAYTCDAAQQCFALTNHR